MILHSIFDGSDRQTNQLYQDTMTCVRNYDRPDIFYDVYAQLNCSEIAAPGLMARVLHIELEMLMIDLIEQNILNDHRPSLGN